jgi:hypothetical protein
MASMSRFLTQKLRLKVNEAKSAVARPEEMGKKAACTEPRREFVGTERGHAE